MAERVDEAVSRALASARRHMARDHLFLRGVEQYFRPGPILELGAATGHLSAILEERGYDVTASDISPGFIAASRARGVKTLRVDATEDIVAQTGMIYPNILAQAVLPLVRRDHSRLLVTLRAIHAALTERGRLICVGVHPWFQPNPQVFFSPREQIAVAESSGLFHLVARFPHQVVPTGFYRPWNARLLNVLDHKLAWIASVRIVWVMEKLGP